MTSAGPVVEIASGRLRGRLHGDRADVAVWRGIPFAAPPVGSLRFAAPQAPTPWPGVRDAGRSGFAAVQPPARRPGPLKVWLGARRSRSEDCLTLSVWSPIEPAAPRPVVVWIHGGSFNTGTGSVYDPTDLVQRGEIVFVAINYRLGALGFIDFHDALGEDERVASNAGLRDQQAALEWVRDNIAAFGGDPGRITVAGESAGSASAAMQLVAPGSRALIHGAISQSGALTLAAAREDAARSARQVLDELGISRERPDALWRLPASKLLAATLRVQSRRSGSLVTRPWWDGDVLPGSLAGAYDTVAPVPLLIGSNRHEHRTYTRLRTDVVPLTRSALATVLTESFGWADACAILDQYPEGRDGLNALGSDFVFGMPTVHLAERVAERSSAWVYRMDYGRGLLGFGAFHAIELMLLFGVPRRGERLLLGPPGPERDRLAERFSGAWLNFVRSGDPGRDWPAYAEPDRQIRVFDGEDRLEADPGRERRLAWAGRDATVH